MTGLARVRRHMTRAHAILERAGLFRRSPLWRALGHFFDERLTRPGRFVLFAAGATSIAASFQRFMIGSWAFSAFASVIAVAIAYSLIQRPRVRVSRHAVDRCVAGAEVRVSYTIENTGRRTLMDLGVYEYRLDPSLHLDHEIQYLRSLAPGQSATLTYTMKPSRRGGFKMPGPTVVCSYPFGLAQSRRFHPQPMTMHVFPAFEPLVRLDLPAGMRYQPGGLALTSRVGLSMEFIGNREYQFGDRVQDLHQRSWARIGSPVVKQFQEEYLTRIAVLVDTYVPGRLWYPGPLEASLSLAAALADKLAREEYVVDLFAAGPELYRFQAGRSLAYLDNILDILASIDRCPQDPLDRIGPSFAEEARQIATCVVILLRWDDRRLALIESMRAAGVQVRAVLVHDADRPTPVAPTGVTLLSDRQIAQGVERL